MRTSTATIAPTLAESWFEFLTVGVAHYIDDATSEVYALNPNAPYFVRVREDDGTFYVTQLTDDRAELIGGHATLSQLPAEVVAGTIDAMLAS